MKNSGNDDPFGKSRFRENLGYDADTFSPEYSMYFKKKWRNQSAKFPEDAEGEGIIVALQKAKTGKLTPSGLKNQFEIKPAR